MYLLATRSGDYPRVCAGARAPALFGALPPCRDLQRARAGFNLSLALPPTS
jgi:hypothetical protein